MVFFINCFPDTCGVGERGAPGSFPLLPAASCWCCLLESLRYPVCLLCGERVKARMYRTTL